MHRPSQSSTPVSSPEVKRKQLIRSLSHADIKPGAGSGTGDVISSPEEDHLIKQKAVIGRRPPKPPRPVSASPSPVRNKRILSVTQFYWSLISCYFVQPFVPTDELSYELNIPVIILIPGQHYSGHGIFISKYTPETGKIQINRLKAFRGKNWNWKKGKIDHKRAK